MPFSVRYNAEINAVETTFSRIINEAEIQSQLIESCAIAAAYGTTYFISDFTEAELRISLAFVYSIPDLCEQLGADRPIRVALINTNERNDETIGFYELVSQNRGWNVAAFDNKRDAETWLLT